MASEVKPLLDLPGWPHHDDDEVEAVVRVLQSGKTNQWTGDEVDAFQNELADAMGSQHAVAVANGTVALELALRALGIGPGDEVVTPSRTFIATASAVANVGAKPVLADVDPKNGNLSADTIHPVLSPRTKGVIPVHIGGVPCDMDPIMELAQEHGLAVVEDCAQAHGAAYKGRTVGSIGSIGAFSFCQDKIMTTGGEGGMCVTNDEELWKRMWSYKDHGKDHDAVFQREHPPGFRWLHTSFGTNWRMTEMQAAIGRVQLRKLPAWLGARRRNVDVLASYVDPARTPRTPGAVPAHYKFDFFLEPTRLAPGWDRDRIMQEITQLGVPIRVGSCSEIYREKAFGGHKELPNAKRLMATSLCLPVHPTLQEEHMHAMGGVVRHVLERASS